MALPEDVNRFLALLRDNPDLLDPAPASCTPEQMDQRRAELHPCLVCGTVDSGQTAILASTYAGRRWLDVCVEHYAWIKEGTWQASHGG